MLVKRAKRLDIISGLNCSLLITKVWGSVYFTFKYRWEKPIEILHFQTFIFDKLLHLQQYVLIRPWNKSLGSLISAWWLLLRVMALSIFLTLLRLYVWMFVRKPFRGFWERRMCPRSWKRSTWSLELRTNYTPSLSYSCWRAQLFAGSS